MKTPKKVLTALALSSSLLISIPAHAGIPVIDATAIVQHVENIVKWGKQLQAMQEQYTQQVKEYTSLNGVRGMGDLVNNPALRKYLPENYQDILNNGYGNSDAIRSASRLTSFADLGLDPNSDSAKAYESNARQIAINRATYEDAYRKAGQRFDDLQVLLNKVNAAPDAKDIADLQARIQVEQVMQQNENTKLAMLANLSKAQEDMARQRTKELRMQKSKSVLGNN